MVHKISTLMAVYNGEKYLQEAVDSMLCQSHLNWELIIVNNGSTDNTQSLIQGFTLMDKRIQVFNLPEKGKNNAYNYAFSKSTGDYICFFAADDVLTVNSLEERLQAAHRNDSNCSTCLLKTFSEDSNYDGLVFPKDQRLPNFSGGSIFFSRELAQQSFPIPTILPNEDTWTSLHLRAFGVNTHIQKVLYQYRIHNNNSYGYGLDFEQKRNKFLERMHGYELFYEKFKESKNSFVNKYVNNFVRGLALTRKKDILSLVTHSGLSLRDKTIFIFYCSAPLYKIRYKYFKFFSGLFN